MYQKYDNVKFPRRAIWIDDDNGISTWRDGQVALTAVTGYKVRKRAPQNKKLVVSIQKGLYTTPGLEINVVSIFMTAAYHRGRNYR
jgi:hypothetical protein